MNRRSTAFTLTSMGIFAAISIVLVAFIHFPLFPAAAFLEYDPADIPILICTLLFGPWWGLGMTVIVSLVQGMTVSAQSGIYGILMHIIATGTYVIVCGLIAHKNRENYVRVIIALIAGTIAMVAVMGVANVLITPHFMGTTRDVVLKMLVPAILPFNLLKAGINSVFSAIIYRLISPQIKKVTQKYGL
ncbi:MAG: ECF transporter S component [Clostridiales bacterium]|nr:ECF transporter S component [Clostridiales bacterium]MBQ2816676.1 ECF transporter S component [Clostridia bacterium]MBQ4637600.1 ECF transporter S component [Clostridia bacterium]